MSPSVAPPLASLAPGVAPSASSLLAGGVAPPDPSASTSAAKAALQVADTIVALAGEAGLLGGDARRKAVKARSSALGWAAGEPTATSASSAKSTGAKSTGAKKPSGPLAFLDDPKLSVEDKLMRLLAYLNDKWDKDIEKKLEGLKGETASAGAPSAATTTATAARKSGGGLLGGVVKAASAFFPGVGVGMELLQEPAARAIIGKLGGPVLAAAATATGFPQLAPLALQYGPQLVELAAGVASATASGSAPPAPASGTQGSAAASKTDGAGLSSDRKAQLELMQIQRIVDQQREMFSVVSSLLRSRHDTRMAVIQNVR